MVFLAGYPNVITTIHSFSLPPNCAINFNLWYHSNCRRKQIVHYSCSVGVQCDSIKSEVSQIFLKILSIDRVLHDTCLIPTASECHI